MRETIRGFRNGLAATIARLTAERDNLRAIACKDGYEAHIEAYEATLRDRDATIARQDRLLTLYRAEHEAGNGVARVVCGLCDDAPTVEICTDSDHKCSPYDRQRCEAATLWLAAHDAVSSAESEADE